MSKSNSRAPVEKFHFPNSKTLWHDSSARPRSLGCQDCVYLASCGGLNVGSGIYDCRTYCRCTDPATCDNVCPNNGEHMVARSMEVGGFGLANVRRAPKLSKPALPLVVPMIFHNSARLKGPDVSTIALSLYEVIDKKAGASRFSTRQELLNHFKLRDHTDLILSGVDEDPPLERWWRLRDRQSVVRDLKRIGIRLITTPNFSLFNDVPRHDNMYNMKRIARAWAEIQQEGIPSALHLNARTDHDWDTWATFLQAHPEIDYVAFEFATGAGSRSRTAWHVKKLRGLAAQVQRPLHLVARGGLGEVRVLGSEFAGLTVIDTNSFMRAQKRRRAKLEDGKVQWEKSPTGPGEPIDEIFATNIEITQRYAELFLLQGQPCDATSEQVAMA